jgi:hypothetical protein
MTMCVYHLLVTHFILPTFAKYAFLCNMSYLKYSTGSDVPPGFIICISFLRDVYSSEIKFSIFKTLCKSA